MASSVISASLVFIILGLIREGVHPSPAASLIRGPNQLNPIVTTTTTTTTESPASVVLDDPANSATTNENTDVSGPDDMCVRCYDKVKIAQDMVQVYDNIYRKQKKLISLKKAAADAEAAMHASTTTNKPRSNKFNRSTNTNNNSHNSSLLLRTLENKPGLIVVSRLRVARFAAEGQAQQRRPSNKDKYWPNKKDAELERLRLDQQRQKDITCKALHELQYCLDDLLRECMGDLQYHSYEVFSDQLHGRLRCPYPNRPNMKPMIELRRTPLDESDEPKVPIARPLSSDDEIRRRLQEMLPDRPPRRSLGVMLKPTMPNPETKHQMQSREHMERSYHPFPPQHHNSGHNSWIVGRMLLVPACFAMLMTLIAVLYYKRPWEYEKSESGEEGQEY